MKTGYRSVDKIQNICGLIQQLKQYLQSVDRVIIEMPYGSRDSEAAQSMGMAYGVLSALVVMFPNIEFHAITPHDLKRWSGSSKNSKADVEKKVRERMPPFKTKNDNIIDSLAIAFYYYDYHILPSTGKKDRLGTYPIGKLFPHPTNPRLF